jgi:N-acyl-phosphatidylethanolamine-hydrolysing phospholipase D
MRPEALRALLPMRGGDLLQRLLRLCSAIVLLSIGPPSLAVATEPAPGGSKRDAHGFQNNYVEFQPKGLLDLLKWKIDATRNGKPPRPQEPTPKVDPDLAFIHANAVAGAAMQPAITWIGHASMLVQMAGLNILTDPVFSERVSPLAFIGPRRHVAPGLALAQLPHIDAVLISHNHYDHLDDASARALNAQPGGPPLFVVPLGIKAWMNERGIERVTELDWWQSVKLGAAEIAFTPSQHWSGRGLGDRMATLWGSYAVFAPDLHWFFTGDTAYSKDFADIRERYAARQPDHGFDLALIAIGAYEPRWFMASQHVNPAEAVQIHLDLGATRSVGVHWGTFELTDEALDAPPRDLAEARKARGLADDAFLVLAIGETRKLPRRDH